MDESPASRAFASRLARYAYRGGAASPSQSPKGLSGDGTPSKPSAVLNEPSPLRQRSARPASQTARKRLKLSEARSSDSEESESESGLSDRTSDYRAPSSLSDDCGDYEDVKPDSDSKELQVGPARFRRPRHNSTVKVDLKTPDGPIPAVNPLSGTKAKAKNGKKSRPFASPEVYKHLRPVQDILRPGLDIVFCGINPGQRSSTAGHHFAHPTNKFWRALHLSGLTERLHPPADGHLLPELYNFGLTNLCDRPTAEQSELSTLEMRLSVLQLSRKILRERPKIVCFVGKKIWDIYESVAGRTAKAVDRDERPHSDSRAVKTEPDERSVTPLREVSVKEEEVEWSTTGPTTPRKSPGASAKSSLAQSGSSKKTKPPPFDWTQPRTLRLPFATAHSSTPTRYTYFWVVPNTSGLERTPLAEQVTLFGHLRSFLQSLQANSLPPQHFSDIDIDGVERTVSALRIAAENKGKR